MSTRNVAALVALAAWLVPAGALAQEIIDFEEDLAFDRPEAWAMKYFTSITLLTGMGAPRETEAGTVDVGFDASWLPTLSEDERRVGFNGTKVEDMNRLPVFARPRAIIGLPADLSLTLGYVPPIEIDGVKPNLFSLALARPFVDKDAFRLGGRFYTQFGTMKGDLTCSENDVAGGSDPARNPFGCKEPSKDEITQRYAGLELATSFEVSDRFEPHVSLSVNYMDMEFQVDAKYGDFHDRSLLLADGFTYAAMAGASYQATKRIRLSGELFYSPLDVKRGVGASSENDSLFHVRAMATYTLRR